MKYLCFFIKKRTFRPLILNPNGIIALNQISHHLITKKSGLDLFSNKIAKSNGQSLQIKFS